MKRPFNLTCVKLAFVLTLLVSTAVSGVHRSKRSEGENSLPPTGELVEHGPEEMMYGLAPLELNTIDGIEDRTTSQSKLETLKSEGKDKTGEAKSDAESSAKGEALMIAADTPSTATQDRNTPDGEEGETQQEESLDAEGNKGAPLENNQSDGDTIDGSDEPSASENGLGTAASPLDEIVSSFDDVDTSLYPAPPSGYPTMSRKTSWLGQFLENGRGPAWMAINIVLLILTIAVALLSLFRLLALRACTLLLPRTLYLLVLLLCFTAAAFTTVHLIHLIFGGVEGLPILLTLILTHTPAPCLTAALVMLLHRILTMARLPWPMSCQLLGRVSTVVLLLSVIGDIGTALVHSTPFLLTYRVTLATVALLPVLLYMIKFSKIIEVSKVLKTQFNGELKLMVPPPKDSVAHEHNSVRLLLRDVLATWATLLFVCCVLNLLLWTCNLSISVFFAVASVPIWLWWVFHITNCICQICTILLIIFSCIVTQDDQSTNLCYKLFIVPKHILQPPNTGATSSEHRNFVYERVMYSSEQESSQRTSSSQNESEEVEAGGAVRGPSGVQLDPSPYSRPRVTLQRSATFNCAPRPPIYGNFLPGYPYLLPQPTGPYSRTGSYAHISPSQAPVRHYSPSMLLQDGGFVRFNMPFSNANQYQMTPEQQQEAAALQAVGGHPNMMLQTPSVDIEYNSLRRFPRHYPQSRVASNRPQDDKQLSKFNPHEIRLPTTPGTSPSHFNPSSPYSIQAPQGSIPVSPYHALPLHSLPSPGGSVSGPLQTSQAEGRPALPSRVGSFRNHYAPLSTASPLASPYSPVPIPTHVTSYSRPTSPMPVGSSYNSNPPPLPSVSPPALSGQKQPGSAMNSPSKSSHGHNSNLNIADSNQPNVTSTGTSNNLVRQTDNSSDAPKPEADFQLHNPQEKSLENTVREILISGERPLFRPRRHALHSSARMARNIHRAPNDGDPNSFANPYSNTEGNNIFTNGLRDSPSKNASSTSCIPMETISVVTEPNTDDESISSQSHQYQSLGGGLKRNHSTAGCYYPPVQRKDSFCQTDDESNGGKYASFRLSQLRNKSADWYGTWAGRRKSKSGAYSIDPNTNDATNGSSNGNNKEKVPDKKLSSSRASLLSIYSKLKNKKEKSLSSKEDSSGDSTEKEDRDEISQCSTAEETPSEMTDGASLAAEEMEEETTLEDALEEILEPKEPDKDWTMDILSSSSVLSDFYKLRDRAERPPPLPEVSEIDA